MRGDPPTGARAAAAIESVLRDRVPPSWQMDIEKEPRIQRGRNRPDLLLTWTAPTGEKVVFAVEVKRQAAAADLSTAISRVRDVAAKVPGSRPLLVVPWIGERSRHRLAAEGVGFADLTGNVMIVADRPGLFVATEGAAKNPWPIGKTLRSLRGRGTARALRALLDFAPPYGVRELAGRAGTSAATLSRVIDLLAGESLLERDARGAVVAIDWPDTIRLWARDYDVLGTNESAGFLQPRGLPALIEGLKKTRARYAVTGSVGANELAPFAPARVASVYVDDMDRASAKLGLREVDAGANVILLEPYDDVVYDRAIERSGLQIVNPTQLAVDLLTGPGRAPSEGEELLDWMAGDTGAWRS